MNAIRLYRIMRWLYIHKVPILPKLVQLLIFLVYNSKVTGDTQIGKGTYFVCNGISTVLIPGTIIGDNCVLGLRFSTVRQFPYKEEPVLKNNVWIGPNVIVAGPVIIEDDVIIVGNSYVTKSIPKGAIVSGNPARIVGWRKDLKYDINTNPKYLEGTMPFLKEKECHNLPNIEKKSSGSIAEKVIQIIAECLGIPPYSLSGNEQIEDIGEWDSLTHVTVISRLEETFSIKIPDESLINLTSIPTFIEEVEKRSKETIAEVKTDISESIEIINKIPNDTFVHSPLLENIVLKAKANPAKTAFVINGKQQITYAELIHRTLQLANYMQKLGLRTGDRILLSGEKEIEFVYVYLASHMLGITNIILDAKSNKERLIYIENATSPKMSFGYISENIKSIAFDSITIENEEVYEPQKISITSDYISEILFTTGTTGAPKGVCLSYANIYGSATNINDFIGNTENDVEIIGLPICHSFGLGRIRCNLLKSATIIFMNGFTNVALFFDYIKKFKATGFGVVPAAWAYIEKMSGSSIKQFSDQIKYIEIGSAAMPLETKKRMLEIFPNTRICMHFGSTEASRSCFMEFHDQEHLESIGKPVTNNVDIKIFKEDGEESALGEKGEICIKGNMVMKSYLNEEQMENSYYDGYFRTGDCGYKTKDGYFYLLGREKELINVGGKKVSPAEVEDIICSIGVGDCVCIPTKDKSGLLGEVVKCYILKGSTELTFEQIAEKLTNRLEAYKRPVEYDWINEIPKTESGKKQRINLKSIM